MPLRRWKWSRETRMSCDPIQQALLVWREYFDQALDAPNGFVVDSDALSWAQSGKSQKKGKFHVNIALMSDDKFSFCLMLDDVERKFHWTIATFLSHQWLPSFIHFNLIHFCFSKFTLVAFIPSTSSTMCWCTEFDIIRYSYHIHEIKWRAFPHFVISLENWEKPRKIIWQDCK